MNCVQISSFFISLIRKKGPCGAYFDLELVNLWSLENEMVQANGVRTFHYLK